MTAITLEKPGRLVEHDLLLVDGMDEGLTCDADPLGNGVFLFANVSSPASRHMLVLGRLPAMATFLSLYREGPDGMYPKCGEEERDVLPETQFLLAECMDGSFLLMVPLVGENFRSSIWGSPNEEVMIVCENGAEEAPCEHELVLYISTGLDPYELIAAATRSITTKLCGLPELPGSRALAMYGSLGWSTSQAQPEEVSQDLVARGLQSFHEGGIEPRFLVLGDGWQTLSEDGSNGGRLAGFQANERFPHGLAGMVATTKDRYSIESFYVTQVLIGHHGGIDDSTLPDYNPVKVEQRYSDGLVHFQPNLVEPRECNVVPPAEAERFVGDMLSALRESGVDGVEIECPGELEALGHGFGGRIETVQSYLKALLSAAGEHFDGESLRMASSANDVIFTSGKNCITRASKRFCPDLPRAQGRHLHANAMINFFLGDLVNPDWDAFQSGHAAGAYHAAARSISGGPVYVCDAPGEQNFELLQKLVLNDGTVPRPQQLAKPTMDCLTTDPCESDTVLKVFNFNRFGGVVGAFNCQYHDDPTKRHFVAGTVSPSDIPGLEGQSFAVFTHNGGNLSRCRLAQRVSLWLSEFGFEIISIVPIVSGFAPIGLIDKFNSGATIADLVRADDKEVSVSLLDGGTFMAWCEFEPERVLVNGLSLPFHYDRIRQSLSVELDPGTPSTVRVLLGAEPEPQAAPDPGKLNWDAYDRHPNRRLVFKIADLAKDQ